MMKYLTAVGLSLALSPLALACPDPDARGDLQSVSGRTLYSPQTYTVLAGGSTDLAECSGGAGFVADAPDFSFAIDNLSEYRALEITASSDCDVTILVNTAAGQWYFNDDYPEQGTNGQVNVGDPQAGVYDVWVGTYGSELCEATLELETFDDLYEDGGQAENFMTPEGTLTAGVSSGVCPSFESNGSEYVLTAAELTKGRTFEVLSGGSIDLSTCTDQISTFTSGTPVGFVAPTPDFTMEISGLDGYELRVEAQSDCDPVLLFNTASVNWAFDDDDAGEGSASVTLTQPSTGRYDFWLGEFENQYCEAKLILQTSAR